MKVNTFPNHREVLAETLMIKLTCLIDSKLSDVVKNVVVKKRCR